LERAQERSRCVFELSPTMSDGAPHALAARRVTAVLTLRNARCREAGEFRRPAQSMGVARRLARDMQARGSLVCQVVAFAVEAVATSLAVDFLRATGLRVEDADLLLGVLEEHERAALPHPL